MFSLQFILQIFYQSFATIGGRHSLNIKWDDLCRAKIKIASRGGKGERSFCHERRRILNLHKFYIWLVWALPVGMKLHSGAEHFGNIMNVTWITVKCQIGAWNKSWPPDTGLWYNVWARCFNRRGEEGRTLILFLSTIKCTMLVCFFWTLPGWQSSFPRCINPNPHTVPCVPNRYGKRGACAGLSPSPPPPPINQAIYIFLTDKPDESR